MSKETDIAISVAVKDGPKMQPEKTKLPKGCGGVNLTKAINEELVIAAENKWHTVKLDKGQQKLLFVAIHADRYKYKDACGVEQPGIIYASVTNGKQEDCEHLDGPHVYVSRLLQPFDAAELHFKVCEAFFKCVPNPDKKKVVINVTYGVGVPNTPECQSCAPCSTGTPTTAQQPQPA